VSAARAVRCVLAVCAVVACGCLLAGVVAAAPLRAPAGYRYVCPLPESRFVSPVNTIVVRAGGAIDPASVRDDAITVTGSASGRHAGRCRLADDGETVVFTPAQPFQPGEVVRVQGPGGLARARGDALPPLAFTFHVSRVDPRTQPRVRFDDRDEALPREALHAPPAAARAVASRAAAAGSDLPAGMPNVVVTTLGFPNAGCTAVSPRSSTDIGTLLLVDNAGQPLYYRRFPTDAVDLNLQNGLLTYYLVGDATWYGLDSLYQVADSWVAGNGYWADAHDFKLLPNGHALLLCYDTQIVEMDQVVPGGNPEAYVYGLVIQELDSDRNVVFQWRSWDFFDITDGVDVDLTAPTVDYVHGNAIEVADDGNLMLSSRNMNEVTKIDRETGAILWRWGRNAVHNDFTIVGDPRGFAYQHDIRFATAGRVTLFDNGWALDPAYARGVLYRLDEDEMTATLLRDVRPAGGGAAHSNGSTQWLPGGGLLMCWGAGQVFPQVTEVDANDEVTLEYRFVPYMVSYRVRRFEWTGHRIDVDRAAVDFGAVPAGSVATDTLRVTNHGTSELAITRFVCTDTTHFGADLAAPVTIAPESTLAVPVHFRATAAAPFRATLYVRSSSTDEVIARSIQLDGVGYDALAAPPRGPAAAALAPAHPNPVRTGTVVPFAVARAGHATLRVYDAAGRRVATLLDAVVAAGDHTVAWNGTDERGGRVAPGVYVCELAAAGRRFERRIVLLR